MMDFSLYRGEGAARKALHASSGTLRAPHHTASLAGLTGRLRLQYDGDVATVELGEVSLADNGTLMLTDVDQFTRSALSMIGVAYRDRELRLVCRRDGGEHTRVMVRTRFRIVATAADCPCSRTVCICSESVKVSHNARVRDAVTLLTGESR